MPGRAVVTEHGHGKTAKRKRNVGPVDPWAHSSATPASPSLSPKAGIRPQTTSPEAAHTARHARRKDAGKNPEHGLLEEIADEIEEIADEIEEAFSPRNSDELDEPRRSHSGTKVETVWPDTGRDAESRTSALSQCSIFDYSFFTHEDRSVT